MEMSGNKVALFGDCVASTRSRHGRPLATGGKLGSFRSPEPNGEAAPAIFGFLAGKLVMTLPNQKNSRNITSQSSALRLHDPEPSIAASKSRLCQYDARERIHAGKGLWIEERRRDYRKMFNARRMMGGAVRWASATRSIKPCRTRPRRVVSAATACREPGVPHQVR